MAELNAEHRGTAQPAAARLWANRWLLAAGIVAVLAVHGLAGASAYVVLAAIVLLLAAALLPSGGARRSIED
ncbi:two-component sensor histidine kinase, partial [Mesorhizobium sp. M4B.F.Ca.ET.017.02.2.1]